MENALASQKVSDSLKVDLSGGALANLHIKQTEAVQGIWGCEANQKIN